MWNVDMYDAGQTALDRTKDLEEAIRTLNRRIDRLEEVINKICRQHEEERAKTEYEKMVKEREDYVPSVTTSTKCDFIIIGDEVICSRCHNEFYTDGFIPSYCPYCFAKREV